jgi:hypothetical protein
VVVWVSEQWQLEIGHQLKKRYCSAYWSSILRGCNTFGNTFEFDHDTILLGNWICIFTILAYTPCWFVPSWVAWLGNKILMWLQLALCWAPIFMRVCQLLDGCFQERAQLTSEQLGSYVSKPWDPIRRWSLRWVEILLVAEDSTHEELFGDFFALSLRCGRFQLILTNQTWTADSATHIIIIYGL